MNSSIDKWLKSQVRGFSFNSAADKTGLTVSTVRRHLTDEGKIGSATETLVAVCRAYDLSPVEGLIKSGLIDLEEVQEFLDDHHFSEGVTEMPLSDLFERIRDELDVLEDRSVDRRNVPLPGQQDLFEMFPTLDFASKDGTQDNVFQLPAPNYLAESSGEDATNKQGVAAMREDKNIGEDDSPHEP